MNVSGTTISATGHKEGLGDGLYDKAGARPDLDLDFARTKSLKDRVSKEDLITFSRSSGSNKGATYVDENGLVKVAPVNLLKYSEDIRDNDDGTDWNHVNLNVTPNNVIAPDGTLTADTPDADMVRFLVLHYKSDGTTPFIINEVITNITSEWQRYTRTFTVPSTGNQIRIYPLRNADTESIAKFFHSHTNIDVVAGETYTYSAWYKRINNINHVWGTQLEQGSVATEYIPTTSQVSGAPRFTHDPVTKESKGLLIEQQSINYIQTNTTLSAWAASRSTITIDNSITNPDGTTGAPKITADATSGHRYIMAPQMLGPTNTTKIRHSVFLKYGTQRFIDIYGNYHNWMTGSTGVRVDLLNGTASTVGTSTSLTAVEEVKQFPNGWIKVTVKADFASAVTPNAQPMYLWFIAGSGVGTTTGTSGIDGNYFYAWGAQTETGSDFATSTIINETTSSITRSPDLASIEGDNFGTYRTNKVVETKPFLYSFGVKSSVTLQRHAAANPVTGEYDAVKVIGGAGTGGDAHIQVNLQGITNVGAPSRVLADGTRVVFSFYARTDPGQTFAVRPKMGRNNAAALYNNPTITITDTWQRHEFDDNGATISLTKALFGLQFTQANTTIYTYGWQIEERASTDSTPATSFIPSTDTYTNRQSDATFVDGNGIIRTAKKNYLTYSEDISQWLTRGNGGSITVTMDAAAVDPYGGLGVSKVQCSRTDLGHYQGQRHVAVDTGTAQPNVQSAWLKAATPSDVGKIVSVWQYDSGFILNDTHTLTADWVRYVSPVANAPNGTVSEPVNYGQLNDVHGGPDQTSVNFYIWGTQMVTGTEAGDYVKTEATGTGPARYSHDPDTLTPTGLYLEKEATNIVKYSQDFTQTNWNLSSQGGNSATFTPNTTTAPDGTLTAGNVNFNDGTWGILFNNSSGNPAYLVDPTTTSLPTLTTEWKRYTIGTFTVPSDAGGNTIVLYAAYKTGVGSLYQFSIPITVGSTYTYSAWLKEVNNKIYIWGVQLELGKIATSYIKSLNGTATRSADTFTSTATEVLDRANGTKPAFYTPNGISIYAEARYNASAHDSINNYSRILQLKRDNDYVLGVYKHGSSTHNQLQLFATNPTAAPLFAFRNYNSGSNDLQIGIRYAEDNTRIYLNDNDTITNRQGSLDTDVHTEKPTDLFIGNDGTGSGGYTNGTIKRLTFWKTPLTDNKLDRLTA